MSLWADLLGAEMRFVQGKFRTRLAHEALKDGANPTRERLTALGQAKIAYCRFALQLARRQNAQVFATIVPRAAPRPEDAGALRKDYAYLFERVFYFLNGLEDEPMGYLVFDEIDRSACHILLGQVSNYFVRTANGRTRARLIIPEPFFVHSDMTTLVQLADIVAYVVSWGVRLGGMNAPARAELALPNAVLAEPTVMFQRSAKHRTEQFQWSCRLGLAEANCF